QEGRSRFPFGMTPMAESKSRSPTAVRASPNRSCHSCSSPSSAPRIAAWGWVLSFPSESSKIRGVGSRPVTDPRVEQDFWWFFQLSRQPVRVNHPMPTLLVVDDEPAIQQAFRRAFQGGDVTLRSAGSAAEAVEQVQQDRPDVIVLDVRLPDATGLETFRR